MIHIYIIIILAVSISVMLHPFPHLMPWKRLLTYYIYNDPIIHAAISRSNPKRITDGEVGLLPKNAATA